MPACAFCGFSGKLTGEHVFGDWLSRIGLDLEPTPHGAGPLNRLGQELGVRPPFRQKVKDVCATCNHGWMSKLEVIAQRVLTPLILGEPSEIAATDAGAVTAWVQKTALTAMLVSSEMAREAGYGLPASKYHALWTLRNKAQPLPASRFWVGRYTGQSRLASTWVTPLVVTSAGLPEPAQPHGYAMTVLLGQLIVQGVRFTTPSLEVDVSTQQALPQLWPATGLIAWLGGAPVDDAAFLGFAGGKDIRSAEPHIEVLPWKSATELAASQFAGALIKLPTICGKHVVYYPAVLVGEATRGRFYAFTTSCECGTAYRIETEADGAHCKSAGDPAVITEHYDALPGEEYEIEDEGGSFRCKRLPGLPSEG
jgi:hypothetical protein